MPLKKWAQDKVLQAALDVQEQRMRLATQVVVAEVKRSINRGNASGKNPSAPGEPPKKVSARLFNSIFARVKRTKTEVIGEVGSNVEYARALELGFTGTDSAGRARDLKPRPYLRPAFIKTFEKVKRILGVKK